MPDLHRHLHVLGRIRERRMGPLCGDPLVDSLLAAAGLLVIVVIHFHADVLATRKQRGRAGASTSCEWIEHGLSLESEAADQRHQGRDGFLCGMELVAAVGHLHHIAQRLLRQRRPAFSQQECLLVLIAEEPALRAVTLAESAHTCLKGIGGPRFFGRMIYSIRKTCNPLIFRSLRRCTDVP
jgi:hypothetical protein